MRAAQTQMQHKLIASNLRRVHYVTPLPAEPSALRIPLDHWLVLVLLAYRCQLLLLLVLLLLAL